MLFLKRLFKNVSKVSEVKSALWFTVVVAVIVLMVFSTSIFWWFSFQRNFSSPPVCCRETQSQDNQTWRISKIYPIATCNLNSRKYSLTWSEILAFLFCFEKGKIWTKLDGSPGKLKPFVTYAASPPSQTRLILKKHLGLENSRSITISMFVTACYNFLWCLNSKIM